METVITDYASYAVGGDWGLAFTKAISDIKNFHSANHTGTEGGVIKIPKGKYSIKTVVYFDNGFTFSGEGMGSLLSMENTGVFKKEINPVDHGNLKYVTFEKLYFRGGTTLDLATTKCFI